MHMCSEIACNNQPTGILHILLTFSCAAFALLKSLYLASLFQAQEAPKIGFPLKLRLASFLTHSTHSHEKMKHTYYYSWHLMAIGYHATAPKTQMRVQVLSR